MLKNILEFILYMKKLTSIKRKLTNIKKNKDYTVKEMIS